MWNSNSNKKHQMFVLQKRLLKMHQTNDFVQKWKRRSFQCNHLVLSASSNLLSLISVSSNRIDKCCILSLNKRKALACASFANEIPVKRWNEEKKTFLIQTGTIWVNFWSGERDKHTRLRRSDNRKCVSHCKNSPLEMEMMRLCACWLLILMFLFCLYLQWLYTLRAVSNALLLKSAYAKPVSWIGWRNDAKLFNLFSRSPVSVLPSLAIWLFLL